ncbi:MAG: chemotaxis protein CheW [Vulcanimicrobiaceae bacterium]
MHATDETLQVVIFALGDIELAVNITQVREIERLSPVTRLPHVPDYIEGVINLRGQLVPIVDLRTRLGLRQKAAPKTARVIVVEVGDRCMGMVVDRVREVARIPSDQIDDSENILAGLAAEYVAGLARVDGRVIILLAVQNILGTGSAVAEAPAVSADKEPP